MAAALCCTPGQHCLLGCTYIHVALYQQTWWTPLDSFFARTLTGPEWDAAVYTVSSAQPPASSEQGCRTAEPSCFTQQKLPWRPRTRSIAETLPAPRWRRVDFGPCCQGSGTGLAQLPSAGSLQIFTAVFKSKTRFMKQLVLRERAFFW